MPSSQHPKYEMSRRLRRNRKNEAIRGLVRENDVHPRQLIYPLFIADGDKTREAVASMPGIFCHGQDSLKVEVERCLKVGIGTVCLFPRLTDAKKDKYATEALNPKGLYLGTIQRLKRDFPNLVIMTDVALDPYSIDGHDGLVENGEILNDATVDLLAQISVAQAQAGADIIGPSDMMDGRVDIIRAALDERGFEHTSIMAYSAKYASGFYGPFRDALQSAPKAGDKKTYQMDPSNRREAILEAELDIAEGADIIMVKPALSYLDVISELRHEFPVPIAAYNVSGEYAMVKATAERGWIDGVKVRDEILLSIRRAGADMILTYFAQEFAEDFHAR
jgi:porphobilinogen synthase